MRPCDDLKMCGLTGTYEVGSAIDLIMSAILITVTITVFAVFFAHGIIHIR
jgi:hypothetical protein